MKKEKTEKDKWWGIPVLILILTSSAIGIFMLSSWFTGGVLSIHEAYTNAQKVPELESQICSLRGGQMVGGGFFSDTPRCYLPEKETGTSTDLWVIKNGGALFK